MREILGDPALALYWWDWEHERYVDVHGLDSEPVAAAGAVRHVDRVRHAPDRRDGRTTRGTSRYRSSEIFLPLVRIAMERDRLYRDLVSKLEQLKASRLRILEAADAERRRLERNLHDGAQQRLTAALTRRPFARVEPRRRRCDRRALPSGALVELEGAIDDLRELAGGSTRPSSHAKGSTPRFGRARRASSLPVEVELDAAAASPGRDRGRRVLRLLGGVHERRQARAGDRACGSARRRRRHADGDGS